MMKKILLLLLIVFIVMQFFRIDKTNPPVVAQNDFIEILNPPADIATLFQASCYDCHANTTIYPWYTNIAPISWWIKGHIKNARENVNFSEWGTFDADKKRHKIEECIEVIEEKRMPATTYALMHKEAKLTEEDRTNLVNWLKAQKVNR